MREENNLPTQIVCPIRSTHAISIPIMKPSSTLPGSLLLSTVLLFAGCNKKPERDATPGETTTVSFEKLLAKFGAPTNAITQTGGK